jgi:hypothetical protein
MKINYEGLVGRGFNHQDAALILNSNVKIDPEVWDLFDNIDQNGPKARKLREVIMILFESGHEWLLDDQIEGIDVDYFRQILEGE